MDLKQLQNYLMIVECQSISKAAERLHIAQPALTRQLKQLEAFYGVELAERSTRHFQLTEAGNTLARKARRLIEMSEAIRQEMTDLAGGYKGTVRIGTIGSEMELMLPRYMSEFLTSYPDACFKCYEGNSLEILEQLRHGVIDIGIVRSPVDKTPYHVIEWPVQPMMAAHIERRAWHEVPGILTWADLEGEGLIVHHRYAEEIRTACRRFGFEPQFTVMAEDTRSLLLMAAQGMGTVIVQKDWLNMLPQVLYSREIDAKALETQTIMLWHKQRYMPEIAKLFVQSVENNIEKL